MTWCSGRSSQLPIANKLQAVLCDLAPSGAALALTAKSTATHRLSRAGDRRLNSAVYLIAVTQVRMRNSVGRAYFDKKIAEGKSQNEAMRCLNLDSPTTSGA